eukprot:TRINITY_DN7485_c1_g1_i1.p1 TRINITY_DN7485_c1_g1~~TRINITY_DN7485_c1_g1_i1.p1  ORF type:complete len:1214 (+),score=315.72 TRINITY_DN7485_c1_g1_i1:2-3643(+)
MLRLAGGPHECASAKRYASAVVNQRLESEGDSKDLSRIFVSRQWASDWDWQDTIEREDGVLIVNEASSPSTAKTSFVPGDVVEAQSSGATGVWSMATVVKETEPRQYLLHFNRDNSQEEVNSKNMRPASVIGIFGRVKQRLAAEVKVLKAFDSKSAGALAAWLRKPHSRGVAASSSVDLPIQPETMWRLERTPFLGLVAKATNCIAISIFTRPLEPAAARSKTASKTVPNFLIVGNEDERWKAEQILATFVLGFDAKKHPALPLKLVGDCHTVSMPKGVLPILLGRQMAGLIDLMKSTQTFIFPLKETEGTDDLLDLMLDDTKDSYAAEGTCEVAISGNVHARFKAQLEVMALIEKHRPGFLAKQDKDDDSGEHTSKKEGMDIDRIVFNPFDDVSLDLELLAKATECQAVLEGKLVLVAGAKPHRALARQYCRWIAAGRSTEIPKLKLREDAVFIKVSHEVADFPLLKQMLGDMCRETGTYAFFDGYYNTSGDKKMCRLVFVGHSLASGAGFATGVLQQATDLVGKVTLYKEQGWSPTDALKAMTGDESSDRFGKGFGKSQMKGEGKDEEVVARKDTVVTEEDAEKVKGKGKGKKRIEDKGKGKGKLAFKDHIAAQIEYDRRRERELEFAGGGAAMTPVPAPAAAMTPVAAGVRGPATPAAAYNLPPPATPAFPSQVRAPATPAMGSTFIPNPSTPAFPSAVAAPSLPKKRSLPDDVTAAQSHAKTAKDERNEAFVKGVAPPKAALIGSWAIKSNTSTGPAASAPNGSKMSNSSSTSLKGAPPPAAARVSKSNEASSWGPAAPTASSPAPPPPMTPAQPQAVPGPQTPGGPLGARPPAGAAIAQPQTPMVSRGVPGPQTPAIVGCPPPAAAAVAPPQTPMISRGVPGPQTPGVSGSFPSAAAAVANPQTPLPGRSLGVPGPQTPGVHRGAPPASATIANPRTPLPGQSSIVGIAGPMTPGGPRGAAPPSVARIGGALPPASAKVQSAMPPPSLRAADAQSRTFAAAATPTAVPLSEEEAAVPMTPAMPGAGAISGPVPKTPASISGRGLPPRTPVGLARPGNLSAPAPRTPAGLAGLAAPATAPRTPAALGGGAPAPKTPAGLGGASTSTSQRPSMTPARANPASAGGLLRCPSTPAAIKGISTADANERIPAQNASEEAPTVKKTGYKSKFAPKRPSQNSDVVEAEPEEVKEDIGIHKDMTYAEWIEAKKKM